MVNILKVSETVGGQNNFLNVHMKHFETRTEKIIPETTQKTLNKIFNLKYVWYKLRITNKIQFNNDKVNRDKKL